MEAMGREWLTKRDGKRHNVLESKSQHLCCRILSAQAVVVIPVRSKEGPAHKLKNLSSWRTGHTRKGVVLDMAPVVAVGLVRWGGMPTPPVGVETTDAEEEGTDLSYASFVKSPGECGAVRLRR